MSLSFICLSSARDYVLDVPGLQDIWNQPCRWQGRGGQHSSKFVALSALDNRTVLSLLETEQLVPDPRKHAQVFRNEDLASLEQQYAQIFGARITPRAALKAPPPPTLVEIAEKVAVEAAAVAADEAAALAEAEALAGVEPEKVEELETAEASVEAPVEETPAPSTSFTKKKKR